jgi:hypothetical protein
MATAASKTSARNGRAVASAWTTGAGLARSMIPEASSPTSRDRSGGGNAAPKAPSPQPMSRIRRAWTPISASARWLCRLRAIVRCCLVTLAASRNRSGLRS